MPARSWVVLLVAACAVGAPPLAVEPPLLAAFDEWEVFQAHSVVQAAKDAKKDLDAMRKAHDVALADIDDMRLAIALDGAHLNELETEIELGALEGLGAIADYSKLVVFMQRCEDGACLGDALNSTEAQLTALLAATATDHASALEARVVTLLDEGVRLRAALQLLRQEHSELGERCDDELYRVLQEMDRHESGEKRAKEGQDKQREGADRRDADKKALEEDVKALQKHQAWECATLSTHDDLPARPGSYAIVRLYDYDKKSRHGKASLWWTLAEILHVVEGDGVSPDSLLEVRLYKDYIKHVSNYAVNSPFERDASGAGLARLRRDAIAYIDVELSGAGDASAGRDPAAGIGQAWAAARSANETDEEEGATSGLKARGARSTTKIESDSDKEEKAKFASRKSGTRIAEVEKRPVVARLRADEAAWKGRDVHARHETAPLELGKAVAWHYAPSGRPGELWFRFGIIVDVAGGNLKDDKCGKNSNPDVNVTLRAFDPPLKYPLNESALKGKFRVHGEEDDPAEALEELRRKAKAEHKRELKKKEDKGPAPDKKKADLALNATLANLTLPPKATEPWAVDPGGFSIGGDPALVVVHRANLAYVGVEFQETKARAGKTAQSWSLKSGASKDVERVLEQALGKWWRALADEWKEAGARPCAAPAGDTQGRESGRKFGKPAPPRAAAPDDDAPLLNLTVGGAALNVTFNPPQGDVAAAIAAAYLDRLRNRTEVLASVDARLDALTRKLEWLDSARDSGLLSEADTAAQKEEVLAAFRDLEP